MLTHDMTTASDRAGISSLEDQACELTLNQSLNRDLAPACIFPFQRPMKPEDQRAVQDEEELLRLQEEMMALNSRPAAKVSRIKKPASPEPASQQTDAQDQLAAPAPGPIVDMAGLLSAMSHIMGEVKERQPVAAEAAPPQPPQPPRHPSEWPGGGVDAGQLAAFPSAVHRKQSKFALGRKRQPPPQEQQEAAAASAPALEALAPAPAPAAVPTVKAGRRVGFAADVRGGTGGAQLETEGRDDAVAIDSENRQLLAAMTPKQIEEARSEVMSRLDPSMLAFLKRRGAGKAPAQLAPAPTAATTSASAPPVTAAVPAQAPKPASLGRATECIAPAPAAQRLQEAPGTGRYQGPSSRVSAPAAKGSALQPGGNEQQQGAGGGGGLVGRLRFDVEGEIVGIKPDKRNSSGGAQQGTPQDVVRRDPLRQGEGMAGEGYTLEEACLLARSSLPQQRVLALRLLAAVLARSRPSVHSAGRPMPVPLGPWASAPPEGAGGAAAAAVAPAELEWGAVWHHALHAADVAVVVRLALDDASLAVVGAAAEALTALVGPSDGEDAALEVADALPLTGWPAVPLRHMQRPSATGGWLAVPARPKQQIPGPGEEGSGDEEEPLDERQLAKVDPLLGLLHMDLLARIAFVLGQARAPGAISPLLCVLVRCCQAGKDVADQVVRCPGMCAALQLVLDSLPPGASADAADAVSYAARPRALRLLRQLAQASKLAARTLLETGLARHLVSELLRVSPTPSPRLPEASREQRGADAAAAAASPAAALGVRIEALRAWRAFALHGLFLAHLDDAFPAVCRLFAPSVAAPAPGIPAAPSGAQTQPPTGAGAAVAAVAAQAQGLGPGLGLGIDAQQWVAAREAYLTMALLCQHAGSCAPQEAMLSAEGASSLARQTVEWLQGLPLQQLLSRCCQLAERAQHAQHVEAAAAPARAYPLSPCPALALPRLQPPSGDGAAAKPAAPAAAAAYVALSTLSAALHFVGAFWGAATTKEAAEREEAMHGLSSAGLLLLPHSASDSGSHAASEAGQQGGEAAGQPQEGGQVLPSECCLAPVSQLLRLSLPAPAPGPGAGTSAATSTLGAAAAELAVALGRLEAALLPSSRPAAAGEGGAVAPTAPTAAAVLGPLLSHAAAASLLARCSQEAGFDTILVQPWGWARWQGAAQLGRASAAALSLAGAAGGEAARADTAAAVLCTLPPGDDSAALQALSALLSPRAALGGSALAAAAQALDGVQGSALGPVASNTLSQEGAATYPRPPLPAARQLSQLLLAGCAGTWLGLVQEPELPEGRPSKSTLPPISAAMLQPEGSRLPLSGDWPLREVPLPTPASGVAADGLAVAGASLLVGLLLEELGVQSMAQAPSGDRLRSLVQLVFAPHAEPAAEADAAQRAQHVQAGAQEELWRDPLVRWCTAALMQRYCSSCCCEGTDAAPLSPPAKAQPGGSAAAAAAQATGQQGAVTGCASARSAWQGAGAWQLMEAKALAEQFAAVSFGDCLFGGAVATLLRQGVPSDIQLEVLQTLADEHALHLLPPLSALPGPALAYLDPPLVLTTSRGGSSSTTSLALPGLGAGPPRREAAAGGSDAGRQEVHALVKLVTEGRLDKCLEQGQGAGAPLPPFILPLIVHRLAWHVFGSPAGAPAATGRRKRAPGQQSESSEGEQGRRWREAALLQLARGCCRARAPGTASEELQSRVALLQMLLGWDFDAGSAGTLPVPARLDMLRRAVHDSGDAELEGIVQAVLG